MRTLTSLMATVAIAALFAGTPLAASAQTAPDPHHAAGQAGAQPAAPAGQPGMTAAPGGQPAMMTGNMATMAAMMAMMGAAGHGDAGTAGAMPCGPGMAGAAALDHVEGRIAFLRAELKITEAQAGAWNAFADALRTNAKKAGEMRGEMMPSSAAGSPQAATMTQRLDLEERWLAARLDGVRAIKSASEALYAALSDEQKKTADELLASPMSPMPMGPMPMGSPQL